MPHHQNSSKIQSVYHYQGVIIYYGKIEVVCFVLESWRKMITDIKSEENVKK